MSSRASSKTRHRLHLEEQMARRRQKEFWHQEKWNGQVKYYKDWEKANNKFEDWTSPRYYEHQDQMLDTIKKEQGKRCALERRREKLKKLLEEESRTYEIELMVIRTAQSRSVRPKTGDIPTEVLKEVNLGIKLVEEDRRRHQAELSLYHRWRMNNPIVRQHEASRNMKDLKLSWLDQQIEKKMEKQKAEEECRKMVAERNLRLEQEKAKDIEAEKLLSLKNTRLKEELDKQVEELRSKEKESEGLRKLEEIALEESLALAELEKMREIEERRRKDRECALFNIRQHKLRLKQKASDVLDNLQYEKDLMERLQKLGVAEKIENDRKKAEIEETMAEFLKYAREQEALEKQRREYMDMVFDSEARNIYKKQSEIWSMEKRSREKLAKDVLDIVKGQIEENARKNKEKQKCILEERAVLLKNIEEFHEQMERNQRDEVERKRERRRDIDSEVKEKAMLRKEAQLAEENRMDAELDEIRKEEERLRREIASLQSRPRPVRYPRNRLF